MQLAAITALMAAIAADDPDIHRSGRLERLLHEVAGLRQQNAALAEGLEDLRRQNRSLQGTVTELQAQSNEKWMSAERAEQIREIVRDVVADAETRASLSGEATQVGYGAERGFYVATPDGSFKLNLGGQLQVRYAANLYSNTDNNGVNTFPGSATTRGGTVNPQGSYKKNVYGFELRRMKLDFFGHVIDPSWQWRVVLIYNQNSNAIQTPGGNNSSGTLGSSTVGMEEAMIIKDLGEGWKLSVGQFKSPFMREEIVSSRRQLAVERSLVDQMFSAKFTQGVMATWQGEHLIAEAMYNDGGSNANTGAAAGFNNALSVGPSDLNNGAGFAEWALTGHVGWLVFGEWKSFRDMSSYRGDKPGLLFQGWLNWQRGGEQSSQTGLTGTNNIPLNGNSDVELLTWSVDGSWNLGGANLFAYWVMNTASSIPASTTNNIGSIDSYGAVVQGGVFVTDSIELYARWEWLATQNLGINDPAPSVATATANVFNAGRTNVYTLGWNWFLAGPHVKLTTDVGWTSDALWFNNGIYGAGIAGTDYRVEPEGGGGQVVVRSQLQLVF